MHLDEPYIIPSDCEGLYIGYSFYQSKPLYGIATVDPMSEYGLYCRLGENEWTDMSEEGTLSLEAVVAGESLPAVDLTLADVASTPLYVADNGTLRIEGTVWNRAVKTVSGFDLRFVTEDKFTFTQHYDAEIPHNGTYGFSAEVEMDPSLASQTSGFTDIELCNIAEGDDADISDNRASVKYSIVRHDYAHKILVEEFTTEQCVNCPRVANYIHESLQKDEFRDKVTVVCHHSGYHTDWLTTSFDKEYEWFFNAGGATFAPAIMVDRDARDGNTCVLSVSSHDFLEERWRSALLEQGLASVDISASFDKMDENRIKVRIDGTKAVDEICGNPHVTVYVVEDNVEARLQNGAESGWTHHHVNRAVNATWGEPVGFVGDDYTYECEFTLSPEWNRDNLSIVAVLSNYNRNDPSDCKAVNSSSIPLSAATDGVGMTADDSDMPAEYYTISGMKVNETELSPGIYLRKSSGRVKKIHIR